MVASSFATPSGRTCVTPIRGLPAARVCRVFCAARLSLAVAPPLRSPMTLCPTACTAVLAPDSLAPLTEARPLVLAEAYNASTVPIRGLFSSDPLEGLRCACTHPPVRALTSHSYAHSDSDSLLAPLLASVSMVGILDSADGVPPPHLPPSTPRLHRVKRLECPNRSLLNEQIASLQISIDELQGRIFEIRTIVDNKMHKRHVASPELLEARTRLIELNAEFKAVVEAKRAHREELDLTDKIREKTRSDARSLREKLPYVKVEQIDEEIIKLEYRLTHTSLALQEEKRLISQIENLRKSRECVKDYDERMDQITQDEGFRTQLLESIKEDDRQLNNVKMQQEEQRRILADIQDREASQARDIPALLQEKEAALERIKAIREDIKQLKTDFSAKDIEYWEREREWRAQQALERKWKAEKLHAERKERDRIRKQRALDNFVEPYTEEITLCDQLMSYMQKHAPSADELHVVSSQKAELVTPQGFGDVIVSKKNRSDDDLEGWFGGFGGKAKGKKTKASTPAKSKERERLSLSLDALTSFQKIKASPPTAYGDVLKCLQELKERKETFLDLQTKAREMREKEENAELDVAFPAEADAVVSAEHEVQENVLPGESGQFSENETHSEGIEAAENSACAQVSEDGEISAAEIIDSGPDGNELETQQDCETGKESIEVTSPTNEN